MGLFLLLMLITLILKRFSLCRYLVSHTTRVDMLHIYSFHVGHDGSVGIATTLRTGRSGDRIPYKGEIFGSRPDLPWASPSLLYNGYRVIPGGKAAGAWR